MARMIASTGEGEGEGLQHDTDSNIAQTTNRINELSTSVHNNMVNQCAKYQNTMQKYQHTIEYKQRLILILSHFIGRLSGSAVWCMARYCIVGEVVTACDCGAYSVSLI